MPKLNPVKLKRLLCYTNNSHLPNTSKLTYFNNPESGFQVYTDTRYWMQRKTAIGARTMHDLCEMSSEIHICNDTKQYMFIKYKKRHINDEGEEAFRKLKGTLFLDVFIQDQTCN